MKRLFALILTLAMVCSLSLSASAVGAGDLAGGISGDKNKDVVVNVVGVDGTADTVYYVVVKWDSMEFTYDHNETTTYDPETHQESTTGSGSWVDGRNSAKVTVTNHSNTGITVSAELRDKGTVQNVKAELEGGVQPLPSAVDKALNAAVLVATYTVTVAGTPSKNNGEYIVDNLILTIS